MKKIIILFMVLSLSISAGCNQDNALKEYTPMVWSNEKGIVKNNSILTKEHLDKLEHVLKYYQITYERISETELLIDSTIDNGAIWNFTTNANDDKWIKNHPINMNERGHR